MKKTKLNAVPLSELDILANETEKIKNSWIPASYARGDDYITHRYNLQDLISHIEKLQLERRIAVMTTEGEFEFFNAEKMSVYKVVGQNLHKLEYRTNAAQSWQAVNIGSNGSVSGLTLNANTVVYFKIGTSTQEPKAYATLFGKVSI